MHIFIKLPLGIDHRLTLCMAALAKGRDAAARGAELGWDRGSLPSFDLVAEPRCSPGPLFRWCVMVLALFVMSVLTLPAVVVTNGVQHVARALPETTMTPAESESEPNLAASLIDKIGTRLTMKADQAITKHEQVHECLTSVETQPDRFKNTVRSFGLVTATTDDVSIGQIEHEAIYLLQTPKDNASSDNDTIETVVGVSRNDTTSTKPDALKARVALMEGSKHEQSNNALSPASEPTGEALSEFVHRRLSDSQDAKHYMKKWLTELWMSRVVRWKRMFRFRYLVALAGMVITFLYVCYMHSGGHPAHPANRPFAYQGQATLKTPPGWSVENAHVYSLRSWLSDLVLWSASTDIEPQRQGPMAALQITGMARDLVREIPPNVLRDGQYDQAGQHQTGLMVLAQVLTDRFMPMEAELATRALAELMSFARLNDETLDACLVRFDVLRNRAAQRGGMGMTAQGMSWLLLRGLRLNPDMWDRVLTPLDGQLPQNEVQFTQLLERVRRVGRLHEGGYHHQMRQGATGHTGEYHFFPSFEEPPFAPQQTPVAPGGPYQMPSDFFGTAGSSMPTFEQSAFVAGSTNDADALRCNACGMFYEDDDNCSATESDLGEPDHEAQQTFASFESEAEAADAVYSAYLLAKQRWRRFSGRPPRRYRKNHFNKGKYSKQHRHLSQGPYAKAYAAFLPPKAFAANRNPGQLTKSGSKGPKKNPRGRDGQPLRCHRCGSDEHLLRRCPQKGSSTQHAAPSMAMLTTGMQSLPSMHFMMNSAVHGTPVLRSVHSSSQASVRDELESLRSTATVKPVSQTAEEQPVAQGQSAPNEPRCPPPPHEAPTLQEIQAKSTSTWQSFVSGQAGNLSAGQGLQHFSIWTPRSKQSQQASVSDRSQVSQEDEDEASSPRPSQQVEKRKSYQSSPAKSSDGASKPSPEKQAKLQKDKLNEQMQKATTLQLSQLLQGLSGQGPRSSASSASQPSAPAEQGRSDRGSYWPWWERHPGEPTTRRSYHSRTNLPDGRIGLLVDPGAHDNLSGEVTMRLLSRQVSGHDDYPEKHLDRPLQVSGVGTNAQESNRAGCVEFRLKNEAGEHVASSYTAPYITQSVLPALLGLKSLRGKRCALDMHAPALLVPGPGGLEYRLSPGSHVFRLEVSPSGHLIQPVEPVEGAGTEDESRARSTLRPDERLDFNARCRQTRSVTPQSRVIEADEQFGREAFRSRSVPRSSVREGSERQPERAN